MFKGSMTIPKTLVFAALISSCNEAKFAAPPVRTDTAQSANVIADAPVTAPTPMPEAPPVAPQPDNGALPEIDAPGTAETVPVAEPDQPIPSETLTDTITVDENFTQLGVNGSADIVVVIDDSGSMTEEQTNLSTKLGDLLASLKDSNWQIGVVTTTPTVVKVLNQDVDVCKLTLIKSTDKDAEAKFIKAVQPGIGGNGNEEGIRQAVNALKCSDTPWIRPDSTVAVLIVSDEDNCSNDGKECPTSPARTEQFLIDYVEKDLKRVVGKTAGFYGIFAPPAESCTTANAKGVQYQRLVDYKANGAMNYGNICDTSYKMTLERISNNIAKLLSSQFTLKQTPDAGSVIVQGIKSNGDMIAAADYTVNGLVITFKPGSEPALGSDIHLSYKVTTVRAP